MEPEPDNPKPGQYQAYFEEQEEIERIEIGRNDKMHEMSTAELDIITNSLADLSDILAKYKALAAASRPEGYESSAAGGSEARSYIGWGMEASHDSNTAFDEGFQF